MIALKIFVTSFAVFVISVVVTGIIHNERPFDCVKDKTYQIFAVVGFTSIAGFFLSGGWWLWSL